MLILIAVVAVVALVGVLAYPNIREVLIPSTPDIPVPDSDMAAEIDEVLEGIDTEPAVRPEARPENLIPDSQGTVNEEPETDGEATEEASSDQEEQTEELADNSTAANDAKNDGINDAYFAKEIFVEKGEEVAGTYDEYRFGNNKNYPENQGNKDGDANYILEKTRSILNAKKEFTTKEAILNSIDKDVYNKGDAISFITFKMTPEYEKIDSAPLSSEVFIVAKTTNLDEETITITIQEKEELLVKKDAPLPVLEIPEKEEESKENKTHTRNEEKMNEETSSVINSESESTETTHQATTDSGTSEIETSDSPQTSQESETKREDAEENEITEIKAIVEEGIAKKKIKLRPKSAEDLKTWTEKLNGGSEDGMHTYQVQGKFTVTGDANTIATTIQKRSNNALAPNHFVKKEDIIEHLVEGATYNNTTSFVFPKYKKGSQTEFLWLKAQAYRGEEEHNKEFLNESKDKENDNSSYFRIGKNKNIIFPLLIKPLNDIEGIHKNYYWAADQGSNQTTFRSNRRGSRKHAGRDLYTEPLTTMVAIAGGVVLNISTNFAYGTGAITILHETNDGRKFIIRYGEVENSTVEVVVNQKVEQGTILGKTGFLRGIHNRIVTGYSIYMIHFEYYSGEEGYDLSKSLSNGSSPFRRRADLKDPLPILREGYENTFGEGKAFNDWAHSPFGNRIALKESQNNYNLCNRRRGRNDYPMVRSYTIVDMTIAEVMALQRDTSVLFATGRYQIVPETLIEGVGMLGLNVNDKYDEAMQDRLFNEYLIDLKGGRKAIINFLEGSGSVEDAMYACAKEWASIGVEIGRRLANGSISTNGQSYYDGIGGNRAHIGPDEIKTLLITSKENINS